MPEISGHTMLRNKRFINIQFNGRIEKHLSAVCRPAPLLQWRYIDRAKALRFTVTNFL